MRRQGRLKRLVLILLYGNQNRVFVAFRLYLCDGIPDELSLTGLAAFALPSILPLTSAEIAWHHSLALSYINVSPSRSPSGGTLTLSQIAFERCVDSVRVMKGFKISVLNLIRPVSDQVAVVLQQHSDRLLDSRRFRLRLMRTAGRA